jgi:predicted phosphoribosyltransferase
MEALTYQTFADRTDAGRQLADRLGREQRTDPVVLGLARGGPVDAEVARLEFGVGAVTADGPPYFDQQTLRMLRLQPQDLEVSGG